MLRGNSQTIGMLLISHFDHVISSLLINYQLFLSAHISDQPAVPYRIGLETDRKSMRTEITELAFSHSNVLLCYCFVYLLFLSLMFFTTTGRQVVTSVTDPVPFL